MTKVVAPPVLAAPLALPVEVPVPVLPVVLVVPVDLEAEAVEVVEAEAEVRAEYNCADEKGVQLDDGGTTGV